jgi:hypothetical protein
MTSIGLHGVIFWKTQLLSLISDSYGDETWSLIQREQLMVCENKVQRIFRPYKGKNKRGWKRIVRVNTGAVNLLLG